MENRDALMRAEFEAWVKTWPENNHFDMTRRLSGGAYEFDKTVYAWLGYKARAEHKQEVDLEKCARAIFPMVYPKLHWLDGGTSEHETIKIVKACLAAAGIKVEKKD